MGRVREDVVLLRRAVRNVEKILGGVIVEDRPRRARSLPLSRIRDVGVRVSCECGGKFGSGRDSCGRCGREWLLGSVSW